MEGSMDLTGERGGLCVIVPTRGRPDSVRQLVRKMALTRGMSSTRLVLVLDANDPDAHQYHDVVAECWWVGLHVAPPDGRPGMVDPLNAMARYLTTGATPWAPEALMFMGDDHRPRTAGWDRQLLDAVTQPGRAIAYGNDGVHGAALPTQVVIRSSLVRALGCMAPPVLQHLYVDNAWLAWGQQADCLTYLPEVLVEHMHPLVGKAPRDAGYDRVDALSGRDQHAWHAYEAGQLRTDVEIIKGVMSGG